MSDKINDYGMLLNRDIKLHRIYFKQMVKLLGINCQYRFPLTGKTYNLQSEEILKILFSYINGTYNELTETEENIYNQLFYKYSLKDKYISISKEKNRVLDEKINMYINRMQGDIDYQKISKKLCISISYVRNFVENKSLNQQEEKLTKKLIT